MNVAVPAVLNEELTKRGLDTISDKADLRLDQDLGGIIYYQSCGRTTFFLW